jgi:hypothetical protein
MTTLEAGTNVDLGSRLRIRFVENGHSIPLPVLKKWLGGLEDLTSMASRVFNIQGTEPEITRISFSSPLEISLFIGVLGIGRVGLGTVDKVLDLGRKWARTRTELVDASTHVARATLEKAAVADITEQILEGGLAYDFDYRPDGIYLKGRIERGDRSAVGGRTSEDIENLRKSEEFVALRVASAAETLVDIESIEPDDPDPDLG